MSDNVARIKVLLDEGYEPEDIGEEVFEGAWESDGKYDYKQVVVRVEEDGIIDDLEPGFYSILFSRSGSYFQDYEYGEPHVTVVEPYEITVTKYRAVK